MTISAEHATAADRAGLADLLADVDGPLRAGRERLIADLLERGYDAETLRGAHRQDRLAVLLLDEALHESAFLTARDLAEACQVPVAEVLRSAHLMGMVVSGPDARAFDERFAEAMETGKLARLYGIPDTAVDEMLVVLGRHMSRLAADMEVIVGNALGRPGDTEYELAHRYADAARVLAPNAAPLVAAAFTAHLRDRMRDIFVTAEEAEFGSLRAVADVAVAFVDVVGFTSLGERVEAGELKSIATQLIDVAEAAIEPSVRLVKSLGDAILLVSRDAPALLRVVVAIRTAVRADPASLPVHCGVAFGQAHLGGADVFGAPVNLASRLTDIAPTGAIWADAGMVRATSPFSWASLGTQSVRGHADPIEVFQLDEA